MNTNQAAGALLDGRLVLARATQPVQEPCRSRRLSSREPGHAGHRRFRHRPRKRRDARVYGSGPLPVRHRARRLGRWLPVVGDWHTHPVNLRPSDTDKQTWLGNLKDSTLDRWHSIIMIRDEKRWSDMAAWSTYWRDGSYRLAKADVTPELTTARELSREFDWMICRTSLLEQSAWIEDPSRLHLDLTVLDQHDDLVRRMRVKATNERLRRLGMKEMALPPLARREVEAPGVSVFYGTGETIVRRFDNVPITVR